MKTEMVRHVAALPYRFDANGEVQVLLISPRGPQRWGLPMRILAAGAVPYEAAAREAFDEAGLIGRVSSLPLGRFMANKIYLDGMKGVEAVSVYPLLVEERAGDWPERGRRTILWFEQAWAARVVRERSLAPIIRGFCPASSPVDVAPEQGGHPKCIASQGPWTG